MKTKSILIFVFVLVSFIYPQERNRSDFIKRNKKFEQLQQVKLLEILNLNEETAVKFITRRNNSRDSIRKIAKDLEDLFDKIENLLKSESKDKNYEKLINQIALYETKIVEERNIFLHSLSDILTNEQIAKVVLFERKFKDDVRDILMQKSRRKFLNDE